MDPVIPSVVPPAASTGSAKIDLTTLKTQPQEVSTAASIRQSAALIAATATLFYIILATDYSATPSIPQPGFLVRDNTTYRPPLVLTPTTDIPITLPLPPGTPTKVYEIGGWDVFQMKWQTLKYGVASSVYDTYGGREIVDLIAN